MADTYAGIHDLTEVTSLGANDEFEVATASGNTYTGKRIKASNMGLLPSVSSGDAGKVLTVDDNGDWAPTTPSGGASSISTLTDVELTSLTDGQILKYDDINNKWVNADETGGGSGIGKKLTGTLIAGNTTVTFSDSSITTTSLIDVYTETGITPASYSVSAGSLTLTFTSQQANVGVVVLIDARGSEEGGSGLHEYSTTEHKVGTWIDGSDVYEITLDLNQTLSTGETTLYHGISNLDKCISVVACCTYNNGNEWLYLPYLSPAYVSSYSVAIGNVNSSTYKINVGSLFTSIENVYVTLQYTKTV